MPLTFPGHAPARSRPRRRRTQGDAGLHLSGKILRARRQTPEERLADVFELTNTVFTRMHEGAMWQAGITDEQEGWEIVRKRLARLSLVHDAGLSGAGGAWSASSRWEEKASSLHHSHSAER